MTCQWQLRENSFGFVSELFFFFLNLFVIRTEKVFWFFLFCISNNGKWKLHVNWLPGMCKHLLAGSQAGVAYDWSCP